MLIVDIDSDDHLVVQQEAIGRLVGLVEEGASTAMIRARELYPLIGKTSRRVAPPLSVSCPIAQLKSSPPVRERRGLISHQEHTFRSGSM